MNAPVLAAALAAAFAFWVGPREARALDGTAAQMQGLDKVTARISTFEVPLDTVVRFGTLELVVRRCVKRPPEESPESAAFVEIREQRAAEAPRELFRGWMFASSPALSALEHPVYDVWVVDCLNVKSESDSGPR
jgi:hypothetical protein